MPEILSKFPKEHLLLTNELMHICDEPLLEDPFGILVA